MYIRMTLKVLQMNLTKLTEAPEKEYQNKWSVVPKNPCSKLNKHTDDNGWQFPMLSSRTGEIYIISHVNRISFGWVGGGIGGGGGDQIWFIKLYFPDLNETDR